MFIIPKGKFESECYNCQGRGTLDCPVCDGRKDCKVCGGKGWIKCPRCKGSGKD